VLYGVGPQPGSPHGRCAIKPRSAGGFYVEAFVRKRLMLTTLWLSMWPMFASALDLPEFILSQHRGALERYLEQRPFFKIGTDPLCRCDEEFVWFRRIEPRFQPYYAVGDINDDGIEDFAVGLVDSRKNPDPHPMLTVVIFHGPFSKSRPPKGLAVIRNYPLERPQEVLYVFKTRVENGHRHGASLDLGAGPFGSDDFWRIQYNWKLKRYVVH
jgi:hypothetical protein